MKHKWCIMHGTMVVQWYALSHHSKNDAGLNPRPKACVCLFFLGSLGFLPQLKDTHIDRPAGDSISAISVNTTVDGKWMNGWVLQLSSETESKGRHVTQWSDSLLCDRTEAVSWCTEDDAPIEMTAEGRRVEWTHQCDLYSSSCDITPTTTESPCICNVSCASIDSHLNLWHVKSDKCQECAQNKFNNKKHFFF